ncbi:FecR family protein [Chitinophaga niastensis]|uniref:FecR family protein n=1 Tax=Chitinophaga niastensis TaxID=536980 RepID=A0A2P8HQA8_CHINA|nr:FecR domain-containing protein [Chitinophaga niastensis]PSL48386.1 FecR family protein [Chitinophaga niastensis]
MTVSRFRYLFNRYYKQQCTPEEQQELMSMLEQSAHDIELKQLLDTLLLNAEEEEDAEEIAAMPDHIAAGILQTIMQEQPAALPVVKIRSLPAWKRITIAACILGALVTTGYKLYMKSSAPTTTMATTRSAGTGKDHARLVLGNGTVIDLEQNKQEDVNVQAGLSASKKDNQLAYNNTVSNGDNNIKPTWNTVFTNKGGTYQVVLPDGTKALLNTASSIRFPTLFKGHEREVVIQGEVYFEIAPNPQQPFIVKVDNMQIAVLGTHFNVMAYEDEKEIRTTLLEGAVNVINEATTRRLQPGQQASLNKAQNDITISTADIDLAIAWTEGRFEFNGNIKSIMRQLARWYDMDVVYEGAVNDKAYTGAIPRKQNLAEVLQMLEATGSIHFKVTDKTITVIP